ncbi:hypothetical protein [Thermomonas fusca]|uniref:Uncharacterized protein n=1 Tax=Thermomonas fusca TaxID=215690 RepID=A0A5R9PIS6_9GAMM|nr:hypothetical protein [Thermomonas fusca]TLX22500.1 hypothetical protein E5S66_00235 [Thermomonas fusca]
MNPVRLATQLALCALLALATNACAQEPATVPAPRAVWTWEGPSYAMLESPAAADEALAFLQRKRVNVVYLYADAFERRNLIEQQPQLYRAFIRRAHVRGIRVYALLGSWYLHTERYVLPRHQRKAVAMLQRVLDYNAAAAPAERFDGVNYDIEPHLLDEWEDATRPRLLLGFLDMTAAMMEARRKSGQTLEIGPAMPFWWDGIALEWRGVRKPVSEHVADLTDYIALMDYRNRAEGRDSILSHAQAEMDYASRIGKRVVIGLEFNPGEPAKLSFHGMPEAAFEREAGKVEDAYRGRPAFAGFVFHHYLGYRRFVGDPVPAAN